MQFSIVPGMWTIIFGSIGFLIVPIWVRQLFIRDSRGSASVYSHRVNDGYLARRIKEHPQELIAPIVRCTVVGIIFGLILDSLIASFG